MGRNKSYEGLLSEAFEIKHITSQAVATYVLTPSERTVLVDEADATGDITIELPPLDNPAVVGRVYSLKVTAAATGTVIIKDSNALATLWTLDTALDYVVCYSDGLRWIALASEVA